MRKRNEHGMTPSLYEMSEPRDTSFLMESPNSSTASRGLLTFPRFFYAKAGRYLSAFGIVSLITASVFVALYAHCTLYVNSDLQAQLRDRNKVIPVLNCGNQSRSERSVAGNRAVTHLFIRHGESDANLLAPMGTLMGSDPPLTWRGI